MKYFILQGKQIYHIRSSFDPDGTEYVLVEQEGERKNKRILALEPKEALVLGIALIRISETSEGDTEL